MSHLMRSVSLADRITGSAGLAILLQEEGAVFSDGRYTEQLRSSLIRPSGPPQSLVAGGPPKMGSSASEDSQTWL